MPVSNIFNTFRVAKLKLTKQHTNLAKSAADNKNHSPLRDSKSHPGHYNDDRMGKSQSREKDHFDKNVDLDRDTNPGWSWVDKPGHHDSHLDVPFSPNHHTKSAPGVEWLPSSSPSHIHLNHRASSPYPLFYTHSGLYDEDDIRHSAQSRRRANFSDTGKCTWK